MRRLQPARIRMVARFTRKAPGCSMPAKAGAPSGHPVLPFHRGRCKEGGRGSIVAALVTTRRSRGVEITVRDRSALWPMRLLLEGYLTPKHPRNHPRCDLVALLVLG